MGFNQSPKEEKGHLMEELMLVQEKQTNKQKQGDFMYHVTGSSEGSKWLL